MLSGHGFSRAGHFLSPFGSVNRWREAAGDAAPQGPRPLAAGSRGRRHAPGRVERRGAVRTAALPPSTGQERTGGRVREKGAMAEKRQGPAGAVSMAAPGSGAGRRLIPDRASARRRRTKTVRRERSVRPPGPCLPGARGVSRVLRPGMTARDQKKHAESMACIYPQGPREGYFGDNPSPDNWRYRETDVNFQSAP